MRVALLPPRFRAVLTLLLLGCGGSLAVGQAVRPGPPPSPPLVPEAPPKSPRGSDVPPILPAVRPGVLPAVVPRNQPNAGAVTNGIVWRDAVLRGDAVRAAELLADQPLLAYGGESANRSWLHLAAERGHEEIVGLLLAAKVEVNAPGDPEGSFGMRETPLHLAARHGHAGIVRRLLAAGANVNASDYRRPTPLLVLLQRWVIHPPPERLGQPYDPTRPGRSVTSPGPEQIRSQMESNRLARLETVRLLCHAGADIFRADRDGGRFASPWAIVTSPGQEMWLDLLLTNARPRTVRDPAGRSLLDLARHHERWEALLALALPEPPVVPVGGASGAGAAVPLTKLNPLQSLVFHAPAGPRLSDGTRLEPRTYWELIGAGNTPDLFTQIGLDDLAGVAIWLRENPGQLARTRDPDGRAPIAWALTKGQAEMAALLVVHGADPAAQDASGRTPLLLALETGGLPALQRMTAHVRRALLDDTSPVGLLELALLKGRGEIVDWLLDLQPNVSRPCLAGGTLLHLAARKAPVSVTTKLLALGVDPKLRDHRQRTPLHLAVAGGNEALVDALLQGRAPLDAVDEEGRLPLHEAARLGQTQLLAKLLPPPALVHQADKSGRTALELALSAGHEGAVEILLQHQPELQRRGPGGTSLLHLAVLSTRPALVAQILGAGAVVTVADDRGRTPLHTAAELGLTNVITKLLNAQAPVLALDREGRSALDLALAGGRTPAARLLLLRHEWSADPTVRRKTPLHAAAAAGNLALVQELLPATPTPDLLDEFGQTPLALAATHNHLGVVAALADRQADVNATNAAGQTPVLLALLRDQTESAVALLQRGADLNRSDTNGDTALHLAFRKPIANNAASEWHAEFQRLAATNLVPAGTTFSAWLRATNTLAALENELALRRQKTGPVNNSSVQVSPEPWKFILAAGADARATNRLGQTPLHVLATQTGFYDSTHLSRLEVAVAELVRRGTRLDTADLAGRTALHEAAVRGRGPIVEALLRHGADPNARTRDGLTAANLVLQMPWPFRRAPEIVQLLTQHGADFNRPDTNGQTALHHLSRLGPEKLDPASVGVVTEFLKLKPDLNAPDKNGDTPLHLAVRGGRMEMATLFNRHGADPLRRNQAGDSAFDLLARSTVPVWNRAKLLPPGVKLDPFAAADAEDLASLRAWHATVPAALLQTNAIGHTPLSFAAQKRRTNSVDFLLAHGARPDPFIAVQLGRVGMLRELLRQNEAAVHQPWHGAPLLHHAVATGNEATIAALLAHHADINAADARGFTVLYRALTNQPPTLAARLRMAGAVENTFDLIALRQPEPLAALLVTNRAAAADQRSRPTPLMFAIQTTNLAAVKILLAAGADPNLPWFSRFLSSPRMTTANLSRLLHATVAQEHLELTRALLDHSAAVNVFESWGLTPLHVAAWRGDPGMIDLLLARGADPNARLELTDFDRRQPIEVRHPGNTPLHVAARFGQTNAIIRLVRGGADLERTNHHGQSPLDVLTGTGFFGLNSMGSHDPPPFGPTAPIHPLFSMEFQPRPPAHRASRDDVIRLLLSLGAKEPPEGLPLRPTASPSPTARPTIIPPAPEAKPVAPPRPPPPRPPPPPSLRKFPQS